MSHLTRGAWIEIKMTVTTLLLLRGRTSHEVRGLKYEFKVKPFKPVGSHLTRGAWIEMFDKPA